ncbi:MULTISPECIES: SipW-dependent-type signal peptide-containing protein [unclassified Rhodococcus (in: high G+C Gram-positive bacteria)]|uniref:SipW-dependent-type signal peptide-containing protein n=1 Tax=unclassified Rhodococcus (in: high G+C Gram-positive bacteria) TaxID=192944 RepID=UPI0004827947|nr:MULTISPECIES: SipW-dependent-type signal peptide-containing protein [unclassified Rhodococcus (in: high G+C Gram-positive bacteria)]MDQ1203618.1 putative ribosomally synthesized peptide with SipW-like signal peptide [Rhodococcus sp. SORGH_AS_0303]
MTTDLTVETEREQRDVRRRKVRALLAGGLVLGVGAAVTLAVWTDNVFGQAQFSAENWNVQGDFSTGGTGVWNEYDTVGTAGTFAYTTGFAAMSPGLTVYAPVALRVGTGTTPGGAYPADVTLNGATPITGPLATALTYQVVSGVSADNCNAAILGGGTDVVVAGSALGDGSAVDAISVPADGSPVSLCFAVTLPQAVAPNVVAGQTTGVVTWQFAAEAVV